MTQESPSLISEIDILCTLLVAEKKNPRKVVKKSQLSNKHRKTAEQCESDLSFIGRIWKPFLTSLSGAKI